MGNPTHPNEIRHIPLRYPYKYLKKLRKSTTKTIFSNNKSTSKMYIYLYD